MVTPASLTQRFVNAVGYKFYSSNTLNDEHLKKLSFIKRTLIGLTKDPGSIVGTAGGSVTFVSILNNLFNRDAVDNSFLGIIKKWALPILSAAVSVIGIVLSTRSDDVHNKKIKARENVLGEVASSIIRKVQGKVQENAKKENVGQYVQYEVMESDKQLPNDLAGKEIKEHLLELCGLRYEKSDDGEYLQTTNTVNEKVDGEEKTFALRFLINKGIDLRDTVNKKSVLKLVSRNTNDLDSDYAVEPVQNTEKMNLLQFLGIEFDNKDNKLEPETKTDVDNSERPVSIPISSAPRKAK